MKYLHYIFLSLIIAIAFSSCKDDDTFSTSQSNLLSLTDTISLDTVFSTIPSPAKSFWVYNNSGDGIRCTKIRLQHGNQTGFRVNVDGEYLGSTSGYQLTDVEIRKGDSIRVFVELTSKQNFKDGPQLKEENLVFLLESGVEQRVNLRAMTWDADTIHTRHYTESTTINTNTRPLIVFDSLIVDPGVTLTIDKGSTIYFHDNAGIYVNGTLNCKGDSTANVTLRSYRLDNMFDYLKYDEAPGHWKGLHFFKDSYGNKLTFTDLHGSYDGVVCDSSNVSLTKLTINSSTIHNCQGYGLYSRNCLVNVYNSQITNTLKDCVCAYGGQVTLQQCTVAQFYPFSSNRGVALRFSNYDGTYNLPLLSMDVVNSIITGYADDEIMGETGSDSTCVYSFNFESSLLRTPEISDSIHCKNIIWETPKDSINGDKHFVLVDADQQKYDFHLDSLSTVIGKGNPQYAYPAFTRDGRKRDTDHPNMGCY